MAFGMRSIRNRRKIKGKESGVRSQESGVRSQESGVRSQESGVRSQEKIRGFNEMQMRSINQFQLREKPESHSATPELLQLLNS
jgi:hypothetical protein